MSTTGVSNSVGPESIGYISRARGLLRGVQVLAEGPLDQSTPGCHFLAGWTLELTLKAYLAHADVSLGQIRGLGHNLLDLWRVAAGTGLEISPEPPHWCELLNATHAWPYHGRYPTEWNGAVQPAIEPMTAELRALFDAVERVVQPR